MSLKRFFSTASYAALVSGNLLLAVTGASAEDTGPSTLSTSGNFGHQDIIDVQPNMANPQNKEIEFDPANRDRLIRFNHIIDTGKIPLYPEELTEYSGLNLSVDLNKDDAYTRALGQILKTALEEISQSAPLQTLLIKSTWDKNDRIEWEKNLAKIVSQKTYEIESFQEYRSEFDFSRDDILPLRHLNDLSEDILSLANKYEYDCEQMSVTEGIVLQKLENTLLDAPTDGYKSAGHYYYASGKKMYHLSQMKGGHAFIISAVTGNIIEATSNPEQAGDKATLDNENYTPYHEASPISPSQNFDDFANDKAFIAKDGSAAYQVYMNFETIDALMTKATDYQSGTLLPDSIVKRPYPGR